MSDAAFKVFLAAATHNWDDGPRALRKRMDHPARDRWAALRIFRLGPHERAGIARALDLPSEPPPAPPES
jgi:hypothetical protein